VAAKQTLEAGMDQLKQQLSMQGLKVEQITITVNPDAQRQQQAQAQSGFGQGGRGSGGNGGEGGGQALDAEGLAGVLSGQSGAAEGRVNIFA
jgi:flagellar hook-length control protein FliK